MAAPLIKLNYRSPEPNAGTAHILDTETTLTSGTLLDLMNAGTSKAKVDYAGVGTFTGLALGTATISGTITFSGDVIGAVFRRGTSDGADNSTATLAGGGSASQTRGAAVIVSGNEAASTGKAQILAGNVTGAAIEFYTGNTLRGSCAHTGAWNFGTAVTMGSSLAVTAGITSASATAGIGYATGAGGTVTQGTSKSTGVTLSKVTGQITMHNAQLNAATTVSFTLTNTAVAAGDHVLIQHVSGGTVGAYTTTAVAAAGSATVYVSNITAGNLSEAIVLKFSVLKSVTA